MKPPGPTYYKIVNVVESVHRSLYEAEQSKQPDSPQYMSPTSVIPIDIIQSDELFMECIRQMNEELAAKQTLALKSVMDQVDDELAAKKRREEEARKAALRQQRFGL